MMFRKFRGGQSIVEYTILIIVVAAALMAMSTYIMRSVNARIKYTANKLDNN